MKRRRKKRKRAVDPRRKDVFNPGDVVVFTARFLSSACAGLQTESGVTEWTLRECACELCSLGGHVCSTQVRFYGYQHLAKANIRHRGVWVDDCPPGLQPQIAIPRAANFRARRRGE